MNKDIQTIVDYNRAEYNELKLIEELCELNEVLIKRHVKQSQHKPPIEKVIEEIGDVVLRCKILSKALNITDAVNDRIEKKKDKLLNYIKEGKYKGGV